ncbi:MAG: prenyltransferase [Tannerella sp.]|jgi:1,4-dihydroxy-2-naphthoate octaprenyltransferase|nr:prenyltransferase [Tannerella sp.]
MNTVRFWIRNARSKALPQSLLPAVLACCMASQKESFSVWPAIIAVLGVIAGHLCMNLFDDYFDYRIKGAEFRDVLARKGFRSRIAKCPYLTSGQTGLKQLLRACLAFGAVALGAGFVIFLFRGYPVLWFALLAAVLGVSYSGGPLRLSYRGLGEVVIGIMFGPLLMSGVYYSACGQLDRTVAFVSVPVGLLVANIVYAHAIMDYEPDREAGKMTLAVLLKSKRRMLAVLLLLLLAAFGCMAGGIATGGLSPFYLFTFLTLPMAVGLFYLMVEFVRHPEKQFSPQLWMGPMGDWKRIREFRLEWFMIRWLPARNLLSFFCIIIIVITLFKAG